MEGKTKRNGKDQREWLERSGGKKTRNLHQKRSELQKYCERSKAEKLTWMNNGQEGGGMDSLGGERQQTERPANAEEADSGMQAGEDPRRGKGHVTNLKISPGGNQRRVVL